MTPEERVRIRRPGDGFMVEVMIEQGKWIPVNFDVSGWMARMSCDAIRQCIAEAVAEERDRCAKVAENEGAYWLGKNADRYWQSARIAGEIRTAPSEVPNG